MGVAAVTLLVVGVAMLAPRLQTSNPGGRDLAPEAAAHGEVIRFVLAAPAARSVALVGSFNSWNPEATPLHRTDGTGVWVVDVPLAPGRHEYGFLVDGVQWQPDPTAPRGAANEYGSPNSVVLVPVRQS
jgi:1,4-alpha-glucan branching enzyme